VNDSKRLDLLPYALHPGPSVVQRLSGQDREKLVSPVPVETIVAAERIANGVRDAAKGVVAPQVTKAVVVGLERVDVAYRRDVRVPEDARREQLEVFRELEAIGHGRERIGARGSEVVIALASERRVLRISSTLDRDDPTRDFEARLELVQSAIPSSLGMFQSEMMTSARSAWCISQAS
jgi:hypothetical protein